MTSGITFSGISSGLDSAGIISQLMLVEAAPQTQLKAKVAGEQSQLTALQQLNTALMSLSTSAASFADGSTWTQKTATSSNANIAVSASSSAVPSSVSVVVNHAATAASATLTAGGPAATDFTIYSGSGTALATFNSGSGSLSDIAKAINATSAKSNLRAAVIKADTGDVLQLTSTKTGAISDFSIEATDGSSYLVGDPAGDPATTTFTAGTKADLTVNGTIQITSDSNTVTVMPGVDLTVSAAAEGAPASTISVVDDGSSRANAMKSFIGQINGVLTTIGKLTSYGTVPTGADAGTAAPDSGVLPGDSTLRDLASQLVNSIFPANGTSLETYGVSVDRYGQITFDSNKFTAAYQADPAGTQAALIGTGTTLSGAPLSDNFVSRVQKVSDLASYSSSGAGSPFITGSSANYDGSLTAYIKSFQSEISGYNDDIAAWDVRLAAKQTSLQTIYTNLETVMSKLSAQSNWLASQISGLPNLNNNNN